MLGLITIALMGERRRLAIKNISGAFTGLGWIEIIQTTVKSTCRTIEQGLLVLAWPQLKTKKLLESFFLSDSDMHLLAQSAAFNNGTLWLIPHFCHADALSIIPKILNDEEKVYTLYRPLKNKIIDNFVREARERYGIETIGRKKGGMLKTLKVLRRGDTLAMLFDQNAGAAGTRLSFMGRECSCTTLPDILYKKYKPKVLFVYTKRVSFWKSKIIVEEMDALRDGELIIEKANNWLEIKLKSDKALRQSWLWTHRRWKPGAGQPRKGLLR